MRQIVKLLLFSLLALLLVGCTSGKSTKSLNLPQKNSPLFTMLISTLKSDVAKYNHAVKTKNSATILRYTYPALFKMSPKAQLKRRMDAVLKDRKAPNIKRIVVTKTAPLKSYSKGYYTLIDIQTDMIVKTKKRQSLSVENKQWIFGMVGANSQIISNTDNGLGIRKPGRLLALKESPKSTWKFIEQEKVLTYGEHKLLPQDLIEKLKQ
jgi:hypothetical protein